MGRHLTPDNVEAIVDIIRGWKTEKLTWDSICAAAEGVTGYRPTRQSLNTHKPIKEAYCARKSGLQIRAPTTPMPSSLAIAAQRIARQQNTINELKAQNNALLEQFVRWQYNAYKYGIREHQLNEPLPRIDRERTDA